MFTPFAFIKTEAPPGAFTPSYSPYAYYDGLNTTYASAGSWKDTITSGGDTSRNFVTNDGTVGYNASGYFEFNGSSDMTLDTGATTSDVLSTLGSRAHTMIVLYNADNLSNKDLIANWQGTVNNGVLIVLFGSKVRGHIANASGTVAVLDSTNTVTTNTWNIAIQRSTESGGNFQLDVFEGDTSSVNKTTGGTITATTPTSGGQLLFLGNRGPGENKWFDGEIAQVVIYDKALSDSEINTVIGELGTHTGL